MTTAQTPLESDVSIVIVNYNGGAFIADCLRGLRNQTVRALEIIVVDNMSTDGSAKLIQDNFPETRLLLNKVNRGFAGGCNDGVAIARGSWIAFLNPDTRPEPRWLEALLLAARGASRGDLIRSLVLDDGMPTEHYRLIETMNLCGRLVRVDGVEGDFAFASAGAAMLFEKAVYPVPLPDDYFLYHEDLHMSWNARLLGRSIVLCRESRVAHIGQASTKKNWSVSHFHGEKNRLADFLVFWERATRVRIAPLLSLDLLLHLPQDPATYAKAVVWVIGHRAFYKRRRKEIQSQRKVSDAELLPLLSGKLSPRRGPFNRFYNRLVLAYCRAFQLPVIELKGPREGTLSAK